MIAGYLGKKKPKQNPNIEEEVEYLILKKTCVIRLLHILSSKKSCA